MLLKYWACLPIPVIPVLRRQRQENHDFEANLGTLAKLSQRNNMYPLSTNLLVLLMLFNFCEIKVIVN
jgi:hypothetical protein